MEDGGFQKHQKLRECITNMARKKKSSITKWECCENKKKISRFLVSVLRCFKEARRGSVEILCMQILCFQLRLAINTDNKC